MELNSKRKSEKISAAERQVQDIISAHFCIAIVFNLNRFILNV